MSLTRRVAFSMTIDPDGAMHDWVDAPEGWELLRVPTQEAVTLVGVRGYQEALVDLCARERAELLVTHPPYDYLDEETAARLRAAGTRVLGWAFDDEIFAAAYDAPTRAALARVYDRYVTTRQVRWATRPLPALPELPAQHEVVLVGRAYERRRELVAALAAAGIAVTVRGAGWPDGPVTRRQMEALYARAAVVLTTADWEDVPVAMVKHRLLDTAMLGAFQIAQEAPDLRGYFPEEEVPSYRDAGELVARVREALADPARRRTAAAAARRRALREHTFACRWDELTAGLTFEGRAAGERSRLFDQLLLGLASRAEASGRVRAAAALWGEAWARRPDDAAAATGLGRCRRDDGDLEGALEPLRAALAAPAPVCARALDAQMLASGGGTGLGRLARFPPAAEPALFLLAALVELGRVPEAVTVAAGLDPVAGRVVKQALAGQVPEALATCLAAFG